MADITTVTLNQLNALTRGSESAAARNNVGVNNPPTLNDVVAKVVISQISANAVTLTNPQTRQSMQLPATALANLGNIKTGQALELVNVTNKPNTYALIPATLTNQQSAALGQSSQLLASTNISVNDNQLSALVGKASAAGDISFSGKPIVTISGRITAISANQVSLNFTVPGSNLPPQQAQLTLSQAQVNSLSVNSNVKIILDVSTKQPNIVSLTRVNLPSAQTAQNAQNINTILNLSAQIAKLNTTALPNKLVSASILQQLASTLPPSASSTSNSAPSSSPSGVSLASKVQNNVASGLSQAIIPLTDAKLADLPKSLLSSLQNAIAKVNTTAATQVSLLVEGTGNANSLKLSVLGNLSKASGELNTSQIRTLLPTAEGKALVTSRADGSVDAVKSSLTNTALAINSGTSPAGTKVSTESLAGALSSTIAKQGFIANRAELGGNQAGNPSVNKPTLAMTDASAIGSKTAVPNFKTDVLLEQLTKFINSPAQTAAQQNPTILTQLLSQLPNTKISSIIEQLSNFASTQRVNPTSTIDALKTQVQALSQSTLAQSASQSQTESLANILSALNADADIAELSPETQTLLRYVREQLQMTTAAQQLAMDAKTIQQLVGAPINNAPINALSPIAASGFLSGLVTLLQVSLASKLQRQSNKQASKMQDQIPDAIKSIVHNITSTQSAKLMQDFRQFDAKHTLSADVAKMLFSHQHHKLKGIESSLQGQDQLYYALPNVFDKNADDIELLVKRETREDQNAQSTDDSAKGSSSWYLTMKLDVGPLGQMLAKTQLKDDEIKLQLYTSTPELKNKAYDMLPFLERRLSALGIHLSEKSCQLGKIPKQLKTEHYQVFETQV